MPLFKVSFSGYLSASVSNSDKKLPSVEDGLRLNIYSCGQNFTGFQENSQSF